MPNIATDARDLARMAPNRPWKHDAFGQRRKSEWAPQ